MVTEPEQGFPAIGGSSPKGPQAEIAPSASSEGGSASGGRSGQAPARAEAPPEADQPRAGEGGRPKRREGYRPRRKVCSFCVEHVKVIDYKDVSRLRRFLSDRARIEPRRRLGTCAKHQRALSLALKRARHLALLPYTAEHIRKSGSYSPRQ